MSRNADSRLINRSPEPLDRFFPVVGLPWHLVIVGSMVLVIVGVRPGIDEALYATGIVAGVVFAAYTLLASSCSCSRRLVSVPELRMATPSVGLAHRTETGHLLECQRTGPARIGGWSGLAC
jgi:hypothetical protein